MDRKGAALPADRHSEALHCGRVARESRASIDGLGGHHDERLPTQRIGRALCHCGGRRLLQHDAFDWHFVAP
jgi:hypothetical protein